jgi:hypothetical protein
MDLLKEYLFYLLVVFLTLSLLFSAVCLLISLTKGFILIAVISLVYIIFVLPIAIMLSN